MWEQFNQPLERPKMKWRNDVVRDIVFKYEDAAQTEGVPSSVRLRKIKGCWGQEKMENCEAIK